MKSALHEAIAAVTDITNKDFPFNLDEYLRATYDHIIDIVKDQYLTTSEAFRETAHTRIDPLKKSYTKIILRNDTSDRIKNQQEIPFTGFSNTNPAAQLATDLLFDDQLWQDAFMSLMQDKLTKRQKINSIEIYGLILAGFYLRAVEELNDLTIDELLPVVFAVEVKTKEFFHLSSICHSITGDMVSEHNRIFGVIGGSKKRLEENKKIFKSALKKLSPGTKKLKNKGKMTISSISNAIIAEIEKISNVDPPNQKSIIRYLAADDYKITTTTIDKMENDTQKFIDLLRNILDKH